jgi:hypothetical protein
MRLRGSKVLPGHQANERSKDLKHALSRHLQFVIDARFGALRRNEETMAAA